MDFNETIGKLTGGDTRGAQDNESSVPVGPMYTLDMVDRLNGTRMAVDIGDSKGAVTDRETNELRATIKLLEALDEL